MGYYTINQIAGEYKVTVKSIQNWKKQFLENASLAFDTDKATEVYKKELKAKEDEIDELAKALGKTTVERLGCKKARELGLIK